MKIKRITLISFLVILIGLGFSCTNSPSEDLTNLIEWHEKWNGIVNQLCFVGIEDADCVGNPSNEAVFNELISELVEIDATDVSEYTSYLYAHRSFIASARLMYTMQEKEEERFMSLGVDAYPMCPSIWEPAGGRQGESEEYLEACGCYDIANENLIRTRYRFELNYMRE